MAQITGIKGADGTIRTIRDEGEYDVWSTVVVSKTQATDLFFFSYSIGGAVPATGATATRLETNLHVNNQFVDESMNVYGIALQFGRWSPKRLTKEANDTAVVTADLFQLEAYTLFSFFVGGDKPFAEGKVTWFGEAGGWYGHDTSQAIVANNVPTPASARVWSMKYSLPIGRIEKFWGVLAFPGGALSLTNPVVAVCRLLGVRARGVQ